ncbi:MAG: chorismate synthase [Oscillospiraceae bacterium]|jgi:chorismate synthase|nr:chorismate synthase [Oscillospiraceae bacterium]
MSSSYNGEKLHLAIYGQSHAAAVGAVLDGLPAGEEVDLQVLQAFMKRRSAQGRPGDTPRREPDEVKVRSGLLQDEAGAWRTCGAPLALEIENTNTRSKDYEQLRVLPRPGHADYPLQVKHGGYQDVRGGGHSSGRLTAALCAVGGICLQLLERQSITIRSEIKQIGKTTDPAQFDNEIEQARMAQDSVGGIVECTAEGLPAGWGNPVFDGIENNLSKAVFAIPAVRGIEFGAGFAAAAMRGSEHNDAYCLGRDGRIQTKTNCHGGVLGGITTGMPLVFCVAFKPTPSIAQEQQSVNLYTKEEQQIAVDGRHDACIVRRAAPVVEAAAGLVLLDFFLAG